MLAICGAKWEGVWVDHFNGETRMREGTSRSFLMGEERGLEHASKPGGKRPAQTTVILAPPSRAFGRVAVEDSV